MVGGVHCEVVLTCQAVLKAQRGTWRHFPRLPKIRLIRAVGEGLSLWCTIPLTPGQPWRSARRLGHEFPGKQVKLDSFTLESPCWIFVLSVLGLRNKITQINDHSLKKYYSLELSMT